MLKVAGAGLLAATAGIHLDLYLTGYRSIPTIGWLFLLQVISAFALAIAVLAARRGPATEIAAASGALFALSTLGGYLLSIWVGLFGFREVRTTAGIVAGLIEVAAFAVLATLALTGLPRLARTRLPESTRARSPETARPRPPGTPQARLPRQVQARLPRPAQALAGTAALSVVALALLIAAVAGAGTGTTTTPAQTTLRTARIDGKQALTNARGFTVYQFARDQPGRSNCYGTCAAYWPPVTGKPVAGAGVTGKLGTTNRSGGTRQATYNGHPLYTYVGDAGPGQAAGNNLNLNGGIWRIVPAG